MEDDEIFANPEDSLCKSDQDKTNFKVGKQLICEGRSREIISSE